MDAPDEFMLPSREDLEKMDPDEACADYDAFMWGQLHKIEDQADACQGESCGSAPLGCTEKRHCPKE